MLAAKVDNALRITALNAKAATLGLRISQALADARAIYPALAVAETDEAADARLLEQIADWCDRYTPYVAIDPPHGLFLDLTGVSHLFGGEQAMLATVRHSIERQGFTVRLAIAGTTPAAYALSRFSANVIAPNGAEAAALETLPVEALNVSPEATHALRRAGLKTIGQVMPRQRHELAARFGKGFVYRLEQALGQNDKPLSPRRHLPDITAEQRFAEPLTAEPYIFEVLLSLAQSIATVLEERGEGARTLGATFFRADGTLRRVAIQTASPTRDPKVIDRLFRTKIDALSEPLDPGFGFDLIRLEALVSEHSGSETVSFESDTQAEKEIAQLIDRLAAKFGAHRVMRFQAQDTHIPEAAAAALPAQSSMRTNVGWQRRSATREMPRRPLRLFSPPEPISVVAEIPFGPPVRFRWRTVLHKTAFTAGPETIAMDWWRHGNVKPARDYFRVEDEEGRRYWVFREGSYSDAGHEPRWYMHGVFA